MKTILLSVVMLLIAFEPAFSGRILKKLDKELKQMGLPKLKKILAKIGTNADEIGGVQKDMADVQNVTNALKADFNKLESTNDIWFDAIRVSTIIASGSFVTITYDALRGDNNAMNITTGIFRAPYAGVFEFMFQGYNNKNNEDGNEFGVMQLMKNGVGMSFSRSFGTEDNLFGTAILNLAVGDEVWVETQFTLSSNENRLAIHFTGKMLKSDW